jgi:hypothetical protein
MAERNTSRDDATTSLPVEVNSEPGAAERVEELRQYIADRQAKRVVIKRTRTRSGQELDWVPIESQTADGIIAQPPQNTQSSPEEHPDRRTLRAVGELELPDAERGPPGTVPLLHRNIDRIVSDVGLQNWLAKPGHGPRLPPARLFTLGAPSGENVHASAFQQGVVVYGTEGLINVWRPWVEWSDEFSLGQLWLVAGSGPGTQTVEAGLQVRKDSYGDWEPHIFVFFTTNNYYSYGDYVGGYNQDVEGWKQVSDTLFPGSGVTLLSQVGGPQYDMQFKVQLDRGNWWVSVNGVWMGYYQNGMFAINGMRFQADQAGWGGEVFDAAAHVGSSSTDMGSGLFPWEGFGRAAYMRNLGVQVDQLGTIAPFTGTWRCEKPSCYDITGSLAGGGGWGSYFYYGGVGRGVTCL